MTTQEMPIPGLQHRNLAKMVGEWVGEETMHPSAWSPEAKQSTGRISARMLDGFFVISDYEQKSGDAVTFRGHGVYSWDPANEHYVMYWFDSMGGAGGVATGTFEDNVLTFSNTSPMGHHRYRYTFKDGENTFEMAMSQDGENWQQLMDATFKPA